MSSDHRTAIGPAGRPASSTGRSTGRGFARRLTGRLSGPLALGALAASALLLGADPAQALGTLVGVDGATIPLEASRSLLVRGAETIELFTQVKYSGAQGAVTWLIAVPNVNNARDNGVRVTLAEGGLFDALDALSRPELTAECEGAPTGAVSEVLQAASFGPVPTANVVTRIFEAAQIDAGELNDYLTTTRGLNLDAAVAGALSDMYDLNYMFVAVELDPDALGFDRVDPAVRISLPLGDAVPLRIGTRPLAANTTPADGKLDLVVWTLATGRTQANLNTRTLDFDTVRFTAPTETDYTAAFDADVGRNQTQAFITEYADVHETFDNATLEGLRSAGNAAYLTRLRGRMVPAVFRTNARTVELSVNGEGAYPRSHAVEAFNCTPDAPDQGVAPDAGPVTDRGVADDATVEPTADAGPGTDGGSSGGGGGGGGGCSASDALGGQVPAPVGFAALALVLGGLFRRRRAR